jgi:hypothetical protein
MTKAQAKKELIFENPMYFMLTDRMKENTTNGAAGMSPSKKRRRN